METIAAILLLIFLWLFMPREDEARRRFMRLPDHKPGWRGKQYKSKKTVKG